MQNDCPYLVQDGEISSIRDPFDVETSTGVSVKDGEITLFVDALGAILPAVPAEGVAESRREAREEGVKALRRQALRLAHAAFHKPGDPNCEDCARGKKRHVPSRRGRTRFPTNFGEIITFDQVSMKDMWKVSGVGGFPKALPIFDLGSGFRMSVPLKKQDVFYVMENLQLYCGEDWITRAYTDNWSSFEAACRYLQIAREKSLPGLPKTNARGERELSKTS